ncbi:hypothetical protein [Massilia sp. H6]|uniref:hypothetical protein n=1 Tax=Massilia sp. H6 TaxID=2970464 RepID=UPI0021672140|nr:hypothetical protein [Massilia sp. H6]UVW28005.1 hypothetical protein NRS07_15880 [Massilia sp. H6]
MNKKILLTSGITLLVIAGISTLFLWNKTMNNKPMYRLAEPMLIATSKGEPYYMIPANTVLHFKEGFAEGHQLYTIEVFYKGQLPAEQMSSSASTESTWLYQLDADDVTKVLNQYPLSKDDLVQILKARKMTRDDLAQIVREWKD